MRDWKYHCSVLGVREGATAKEVRRAYRQLALELHPDKHNNSTRSKEDFQKLHDSYQFLIDALAERSPPAPRAAAPSPPSANVDREAPTSPGFRAPAVRRSMPPSREPRGGSLPARATWKMWLHALAAGCAVLALSLFLELGHHEPQAGRAPVRDLASRSWCRISKPGADASRDAFEYWTEKACQEKCDAAAKRDQASTCSWSGVVFRGAPTEKAQAPAVSCQIMMERAAEKPEALTYSGLTEDGCTKACLKKGDLEPRAGLVCTYGGKEVGRQARYVAPPETELRAPAISAQDGALPRSTAPSVDAETAGMASTCFLTSLAPGSTIQEEYTGDTLEKCVSRCDQIILQHPLEREVRCMIFGREVVTYVPDGTAAHLARNPGSAPGGMRQGLEMVNNCEVYVSAGDVRLKAAGALMSAVACEEKCHDELRKAHHGNTVTCAHAGKEFFRQDVP